MIYTHVAGLMVGIPIKESSSILLTKPFKNPPSIPIFGNPDATPPSNPASITEGHLRNTAR